MDDFLFSAGGYALGFLSGKIWKFMAPRFEKGKVRNFLHQWGILLVAAMFLGSSSWFLFEQQKCNENFAENLATRSVWAKQDRNAEHKKDVKSATFWSAVIEHPEQREHNRKLAEIWVDSIKHANTVYARNNVKRAHTPLPDLASCD